MVNVSANDVNYTGTVKTPRSSDLEGSGSAAPVPTQEAVVPVVPVPPTSGADSLPALLGILAALIVAILVLSYISYRRRERQYLRTQQVLWYTTAQGTGAPKPDFAQHGIITAFDEWLSKRKSYPETEAKLDTAGMAMSPGMWLLIRLGRHDRAGPDHRDPDRQRPDRHPDRAGDRLAGHPGVGQFREPTPAARHSRTSCPTSSC